MTVRLVHRGVVVNEVNFALAGSGLIEILVEKFGIDFSQYRLSDMRQSLDTKTIDFLLKEEDYIKLRNNRINKILD